MALFNSRLAQAAPIRQGEVVLLWLDQPEENPVPEVIDNQLVWEDVDSWITPNDKFFGIAHYDWPETDAGRWQLAVDGLVENPLSLTLADLMARPRQASTPSPPAPWTAMARFSLPRMTPGLPTKSPTGRATARLPGE